MGNPTELANIIEYRLSRLRIQNRHHDFEHLCRDLARKRLVSNILPATGPVAGSGDQGRDFETFHTYLADGLRFSSGFLGLASTDTVVFACTTQPGGISAKIKADVRSICTQGTPVDRIYFFCTEPLKVAERHTLKDWAVSAHDVALEVFDGPAIAELLSDPDVFWIARTHLHLPIEPAPAPLTIQPAQSTPNVGLGQAVSASHHATATGNGTHHPDYPPHGRSKDEPERDRARLGRVPQWLRDFAAPAVETPVRYPRAKDSVEESDHHQVPVLDDEMSGPQIQTLLGLSRLRWWQLRTAKSFPAATTAQRDSSLLRWDVEYTLRHVARIAPHLAQRVPRLWRPAPPGLPASLEAARERDGYFLQLWRTAETVLCIIHPCGERIRHPRDLKRLFSALPHLPDTAVFVTDLYGRFGPELVATDTATPTLRYAVSWEGLKAHLRADTPWWPRPLRRPEQMANWRPGDPEAAYETTSTLDVTPLLELADTEAQDSPARIAVLALAAEIRDRTIMSADVDLNIIATLPGQLEGPFAAARPLHTGYETYAEIPPPLLREGWGLILNRSDRLAFACTRLALQWNVGEHFPCGGDLIIDGDDAPPQWVGRLIPGPPTAHFTRFAEEAMAGVILQDPLTGLPVVRENDDHPGDVRYHTVAPWRLPAGSPLSAVILAGTIWIRTADGTLYPAPRRADAGLSIGYRGTGPTMLAVLLDRLLDDITAEAVDYDYEQVSVGLLNGTTGTWQHGDVLTRNQLLLTRQNSATMHRQHSLRAITDMPARP